MISKKLNKKIKIGISIISMISLIFSIFSATTISLNSRSITWDVTLNVVETGGLNDWVVFGEAPDANDGPPADSYDYPKPPAPMPSYVRAWFNNGLPDPYSKLGKDYRHYPDVDKTWDLYVQWVPSDDTSPTTVTISWSTVAVDNSEYDQVKLCDSGGNLLKDMLTQSSYTYTASALITTHFKIICHKNQAPNAPSNPTPSNGATNVLINQDLSWTCSDPDGDPLLYDVYFGTAGSPPIVSHNQTGTTYDTGVMNYGITYYWKIVAWDNHGAKTVGPIWSFTTKVNNPPNIPSNPSPANGATNIGINVDLSWTGGDPDGDPVTYDVYFGTSASPPKLSSNQTGTTFDPGIMNYNTKYYWRIVAWDDKGASASGPIWSFTTVANQPPVDPLAPAGPTSGRTNTYYEYTASTTDPENHNIYYLFNWGDGTNSGWLGPVASGNIVTAGHSWSAGGIYEVTVKAKDSIGAESGWSPALSVDIVDNYPPERPGPPSGPQFGYINVLYRYSASTTDPDGDQVYYMFNWGDGTTSNWLGPYASGAICYGYHGWTTANTYSMRVKAKDTYDQETSWSPIYIVVIEEGLTVDINGPYYGFEGMPVTFTSTVTSGIAPYSYLWDFGDGKNSTLANPAHTYTTKGIYQVLLTVTDSQGIKGQDTTYANIAEYTGFGVNAGGPYTGKVNELIQFVSIVAGGTAPYTYTWDFGDGNSSSESNPQHAYTSANIYTVTLTVVDHEGRIAQDTTTATITLDDTTPPTITIMKPTNKLYLFNKEIINLRRPVIIGKIDIDVQVTDAESGVDRVSFFVDGNLKTTLYAAPYTWTWDTPAFFKHTVKVVAYDKAGNDNEMERSVWKFF